MLVAEPLFSLYRHGHEEVCVFGEIAITSGDSAWLSGDAPSLIPARSLLKPIQFEATGLADGSAALTLRQVPAFGSISVTLPQMAELERWHARDPLTRHLGLPASLPMDEEHRVRILGSGDQPSPFFHPCFSKHMAILAASAARGWPLSDYLSPSHPYHHELLRVLAPHLAGRGIETLEVVTDGCGLPTPVLSTLELASIYRALALAEEGPLARIRRAMQTHPDWVAGAGRTDTRLMQKNARRLIAKEGADGLLAVGIRPDADRPGGIGCVVKLAAGHQPAWAALALAPFLEAHGLTAVRDVPAGQDIVWHVRPDRARPTPRDVSPLLHDDIAVWPGDVPYRRQLTTEIGAPTAEAGPAWELTVSSIHTTLHVGAHADAPNHFTQDAAGIDRVPLAPYRGLCQVIECPKPRGTCIGPVDIAGVTLRAPRLLFKTGSFPDPDVFNPDFVAFAPELIDWLIRRGVLLVGIDTPSVDPFSSKSLPTHHATREHATPETPGIAILEGLDLREASAGLYELIALPLRLEGADASPVRATLWPLR